ncbi:MAG: sulfotransferase [Hydrogenophilaceae bacterium]
MSLIWWGMGFTGWSRLLGRNRFQVAPRHWAALPFITLSTLRNSSLGLLQTALLGRHIRQTKLVAPPLFIIGHWRTGTTLLHELMSLDDRYTSPTTYDCIFPQHFLLTRGYATRLYAWAAPKQRPMDNMRLGWDTPQEDEFALCNLGLPSPYLTIAFPNRAPQFSEYLDLQGLAPAKLNVWREVFLTFLRGISYRTGKRIVLKSPTHSYRIKALLEIFPEARFIHIVRNPYQVIPSTLHLWHTLYSSYGLQDPDFRGLEDQVFANFERLYQAIEDARPGMRPEQFQEVRYEDLLRDPAGEMKRIYDRLGLGDFAPVRPHVEAYFAQNAGYKRNEYRRNPEIETEINSRFDRLLHRFGYEAPQAGEERPASPGQAN